MTQAEKTDEELIADLHRTAGELERRGWSQTRIYLTLKEYLPDSQYDAYLKSKDIRDIAAFLRYLQGEDVSVLKEEYGVKSWTAKTICFKGFRKVGKVMPVNFSMQSPLRQYPLSDEAVGYWKKQARAALERLENELAES